MAQEIIFRKFDEQKFWQHWEKFLVGKNFSSKYLKLSLDYRLAMIRGRGKLVADSSFIFLRNGLAAGGVFLPIEKRNGDSQISDEGCYLEAPLFADKNAAKVIFSTIDQIAEENKITKVMFSIDPLEKDRLSFNYLQNHEYLDASVLAYVVDLSKTDDLLASFRADTRQRIRGVLKNKDFKLFFIDKNNSAYEIHEQYRLLHDKCSGRVTRPKDTFDLQFKQLEQGNAALFGLSYRGGNIAYTYFELNNDKAIYSSCADNPDYDKFSLYHALVYSAFNYLKERGVRYVDMSQPVAPSAQRDYYPDKKQLNIALFKRGFGGEYVQNFRGVKYFSRQAFLDDEGGFIKNYQASIKNK